MAQMRYRDALNAALREELRRDERVLLMGEDIGVFGGAFKVTAGLLEEFGERLAREGVLDEAQRTALDARAIARVDAAVVFAENSPFPAPESLYEDVYVLDEQVRGTYSVSTTGVQEPQPQAALADGSDEIPQQFTDALLLGEDAS